MDSVFILNSLLLGVGMAMDAFSVSMANALHEPDMSKRKMAGIAGVYAAFQYAMPMIGWICVHTVTEKFTAFQKFIPWIALALLLYIGGKMLVEALKERKAKEEDMVRPSLTLKALLVQGIATSIDALSVGFTIAGYTAGLANMAGLIIAVVTFVICCIGLFIGRKAGKHLSWKASVLGGCILIGIGIEIFLKGIL